MTAILHVHGPTVIAGCCDVVLLDGLPVCAVLGGPALAERIGELLHLHGLADVPADASTLTEDH